MPRHAANSSALNGWGSESADGSDDPEGSDGSDRSDGPEGSGGSDGSNGEGGDSGSERAPAAVPELLDLGK